MEFEEVQSSAEDKEKIRLLLEIYRKERDKAVFNSDEFIDVTNNSAMTSYLETTYILDKTRWS